MWRNRPFRFPAPPEAKDDMEEAREERRGTTERFLEVAGQGPEVRRVSSEMRRLRIQNGYEELIALAMERRRHPR